MGILTVKTKPSVPASSVLVKVEHANGNVPVKRIASETTMHFTVSMKTINAAVSGDSASLYRETRP